jgi:polysaccharide deacetylase 2 family uncharacterized protein YibQ
MRQKKGQRRDRLKTAAAAFSLLIGLCLVGLALYRPTEPPPQTPKPVVAVVPPAVVPPAPVIPKEALPAWRKNAVPSGPPDARPMIAIVLDDMGLDRPRSAAAMALPAPLTLSFLAYAPDLATQTAAAHARGHELMLHIPMQPQSDHVDPGRNALTVDLDDAEINRRLAWDLARIEGITGANNHMGSRFTEWPHGMAIVETMLQERGLFILDSRTTPRTVAIDVANRLGLPHAQRDVFLDDDMAATAVAAELQKTEAVARRNGYAIAIGHPHDNTLAELRRWLPQVAAPFHLVPVSAIVMRNEAAQMQESAD